MELFKGIPDGLLNYAFSKIAVNDEAHSVSHILEVATEAKAIANAYSLDEECMALAALLHDAFSRDARDTHHIRSRDWTLEHLHEWGYNRNTVDTVAMLCYEHRSSMTGPTDNVGILAFRAADIGKPNFYRALERSVKYRGGTRDNLTIDVVTESIEYLRVRFGKEDDKRKNRIHAEFYRDRHELFMGQLFNIHPSAALMRLKATMR